MSTKVQSNFFCRKADGDLTTLGRTGFFFGSKMPDFASSPWDVTFIFHLRRSYSPYVNKRFVYILNCNICNTIH